ncbi:MAG: 4-hydroxybenzoate 3-monooxygenase [Burkholderiales bacterium]|nr:4-hydroxybenzoate 3-monooxygenase [Burkholderiales bacterium]
MLSHLLHRAGIASVVLEARDRDYVEQRVRAGVLEQGVVDLLNEAGVGERMQREGLRHEGIELRFGGTGHRIDFPSLTGGRAIMVYGQQEVVKDLIRARLADGGTILFDVANAMPQGFDTGKPSIRYTHAGAEHMLACDFIAGCDGFHGVSRQAIPAGALSAFERTYPFAWLGILAQAPPTHDELIYAYHDHGFALYSMRSPQITRLYLQVAPDADLAAWPDARIWSELHARLETGDGWKLTEGPVLERLLAPMRSFVAEPMRFGRLFLAGDAAHIVPPTGAKGMNLAMADVRTLAHALAGFYATGREDGLAAYSPTCLARIWRAEHFSWWMTSMLHRFPDDDAFGRRLQRSQLEYVTSSRAAAASLAENYVGLPFADLEELPHA